MKDQIKTDTNLRQCPICLKLVSKESFLIFSKCQHQFCSSCLNYHIAIKIRHKKMINCMEYKCPELLLGDSDHIKTLCKQIKDKYFQIILEYAHSQLIKCITDKCTGFIIKNSIKKDEGRNFLICDQCTNKFCPKCKNEVSLCNCKQNSLTFQHLKKQFNYKRCPKCGHAIEKIKGCYHLTCICQHQFCEYCSIDWVQGHLCLSSNDSANQLLDLPENNRYHHREIGSNGSAFILCMYSLAYTVYIIISLIVTIEIVFRFLLLLLLLPVIVVGGTAIGFKSWKISEQGLSCKLILLLVIYFPFRFLQQLCTVFEVIQLAVINGELIGQMYCKQDQLVFTKNITQTVQTDSYAFIIKIQRFLLDIFLQQY